MLILLPPSEGKTPADAGNPVDLGQLHFADLTEARQEVAAALAVVSAREDALAHLGVGASLAHDVLRNTRLADEPAAPAHSIYTGVLYDALGYHSMTATQKRKADAVVVVVSGLWGAVAFSDSIPAYRLSMSVGLPGLGKLASYWKPKLGAALAGHAEGQLLVDCRSSTYAAAWVPEPERTVAVNVFTERDGTRKVVSHFAKHTRGELARHLLTRRGKAPETPAQLARAAGEKWVVELVPGTPRKHHTLNIILAD
ncbi:peroxide stress protein YaaA [Arthrobacter livingstonensis]|uniref:Peroxide stress protein YaaA n=1 Tax=Arthrobacter livingstonensis TaxID=670078 RepID=A0A2V5L9S7_9MICC|nr:peroxide stress protein YaaA [Arthrobacter livingstonensis]PYI66463.1 peroxide stress protein YaaA [Arthrobacter livingstonensis]